MLSDELAPALRASGTTASLVEVSHAGILIERTFEHQAFSRVKAHGMQFARIAPLCHPAPHENRC
jgi:hypothetical protein